MAPTDPAEEPSDAPRRWVLAQLGRVPADGSDTVSRLRRLCRALASGVGLDGGVVVDVRSRPDSEAVLAASSAVAEAVASLEFDVGEGPGRDAFARGRSVLVPDLRTAGVPWPGFASVAGAAGVRAAYAVPLVVGAARFGVLSGYSTTPRHLARTELVRVVAGAELATEVLLALPEPEADGTLEPGIDGVLGMRTEVYQAQGMVMAAHGITLVEAMARMRGHAFATGRSLLDVSTDIVRGHLQLTRDRA